MNNDFIIDLEKALNNAVPPTITDERADNHDKTAEWAVVSRGVWTCNFKCPLCNAGVVCCYLDTPKFCHNCGASMSFDYIANGFGFTYGRNASNNEGGEV